MKCIEETVTATDGLRLYIRRCEVPNGPGEVLITHGFGEHSGRYDALMEHLTNHGYSVTAYDHRGHGLSDGLPGHVESFDEYDQDLAKMVETIRALRQPTDEGDAVAVYRNVGVEARAARAVNDETVSDYNVILNRRAGFTSGPAGREGEERCDDEKNAGKDSLSCVRAEKRSGRRSPLKSVHRLWLLKKLLGLQRGL